MNKQVSKKLEKLQNSVLKCLYDAEMELESLVDDKQEKFDNLVENMWYTPVAAQMDDELNSLNDLLDNIHYSISNIESNFTNLGLN